MTSEEKEETEKVITTRELGVKMDQNTVEVKLLRTTLVEQMGKLIETQSGRVPEGFIPLATYKEHVDAYKDTFKFFAKIMAVTVLGMFGLSKLNPDFLSNFTKLWGN